MIQHHVQGRGTPFTPLRVKGPPPAKRQGKARVTCGRFVKTGKVFRIVRRTATSVANGLGRPRFSSLLWRRRGEGLFRGAGRLFEVCVVSFALCAYFFMHFHIFVCALSRFRQRPLCLLRADGGILMGNVAPLREFESLLFGGSYIFRRHNSCDARLARWVG